MDIITITTPNRGKKQSKNKKKRANGKENNQKMAKNHQEEGEKIENSKKSEEIDSNSSLQSKSTAEARIGTFTNSKSGSTKSNLKRKSPEPSSITPSKVSHKKSNNHQNEFKDNSKQKNGHSNNQKESNSKGIPYQFSHKDAQLFVEDRRGTPLKRLVLNNQVSKEILDIAKEKEKKNKEEKEKEEEEREELDEETGKLVEMNEENEESTEKAEEKREKIRSRANSLGMEEGGANLFALLQASPLPPLDWVNPELKTAPSTPLSSKKVDMKAVASAIDVEKIVEETQEAMENTTNSGSRLSDIFSIIKSAKSPKAPTVETQPNKEKEVKKGENKGKLNANAPEFIPFGSIQPSNPKPSQKVNNKGKELPLPPWCFGTIPHNLSEEIELFEAYISPSRQEKMLRFDVFNRLEDIILQAWPNSQVHIFGSFASDLFLPYSDLDVVVLECPPASMIIHQLGKMIERSGMATTLTVLDTARVPIIKFSDKRTGINVDISFNIVGGLSNTAIVKQFCSKIPLLRPLTLVIKYFLQQRGLNEPYTGGIGSYALVILVINFLQMYSINSSSSEGVSTGKLLTDFFDFFGTKFNYWTTGISIKNGGGYFQKENRGWFEKSRPFLMSIEDPQDEENDVSKNSFAILTIRSTFSHAYHLLTAENINFASTPLGRILNVSKAEEMEQHRRHFHGEF
eukprot:TRINITY_DN5678_c0_g1_i1.p1 TRINITY_DN5678_c0_g1~~TRINITY_DN5678_c0_g1_i1.p1  ORF type:complete len:685 (+),score=259.03 TRINITY_DN5678_c0_g1_i1:273-2327(+)